MQVKNYLEIKKLDFCLLGQALASPTIWSQQWNLSTCFLACYVEYNSLCCSHWFGCPGIENSLALPLLIIIRIQAEHLSNINEVVNRLAEADMHLKKDKCVFMAPAAVECFRHRITKEGLQPTQSKVEVITKALPPHNLTELKVLITYYGKFFSHLSITGYCWRAVFYIRTEAVFL